MCRGGVCLLALACAALGLAAPTPAPTPTPLPPPPPHLSNDQFIAIFDYGWAMRICELGDLADAMYMGAVKHNQELHELAPMRVRILAEYAFFLQRTGRESSAEPFLQALRGALDWMSDPPTRHAIHRAEAWQAIRRKNWQQFMDHTQGALAAAGSGPESLPMQAHANLLRAEGLLAQGRPADALDNAENAMSLYALARMPLGQVDVYRAIARCHEALEQRTAARMAWERAQNPGFSLDEAPIFHLPSLRSQAAALQAELARATSAGQFDRSIRAALSLLRLRSARMQGRPSAMGEMDTELRDVELMLHMAIAMHLGGHALASRAVYEAAETASAREIAPQARARHHWLKARYLRVAGDLRLANESLNAAERIVKRIGQADAELSIGVLEERGMGLLASGHPSAATRLLSEALDTARRAGQALAVDRLKGYVEAIERGATDPIALTVPPRVSDRVRRETRRKERALVGPVVFRSPFAADYEDDAARSAADLALAVPLHRPRPSPTRMKLSADILIQTGEYRRAAEVLEEEIQRQGETVQRLQQLGQCYYNSRQWERAEKVLRRVLELKPDDPRATGYLRNIDSRRRLRENP